MAAKALPNRMPDRMKSALAPATNVPMLPEDRDAKVNGIHAAILLICHSQPKPENVRAQRKRFQDPFHAIVERRRPTV